MHSSDRENAGLPAMTSSQSLVWMSQRLAPESSLFNMAHRFDLRREIDPDCFVVALQALVDHCDAMRCVFTENGEQVEQRVLSYLQIHCPVVDLSAQSDPDAAAEAWVHDRAQRVLDLSRCCHESALLKLGDSHWVWFLNLHHLIADAWSVSLICKHLGSYYDTAVKGPVPIGEPLPDYLDYRRHEYEWRQGKSFERAQQYWRERLAAPSGLVALYGRKGSRRHTESKRLIWVSGSSDLSGSANLRNSQVFVA